MNKSAAEKKNIKDYIIDNALIIALLITIIGIIIIEPSFLQWRVVTDIMTQSTELLFYGEGSREMAENAFKMEPENDAFYLEGVVSRKKQLIPPLMEAAQMSGDYA